MTNEDLTALLLSLGDTPDAVADSLRAAGCKGKKMAPCECPVANWLLRQTQRTSLVEDRHCWLYPPDGDYASPGRLKVATPAAVAQFISGFDHGQYADLVR